MVQVYGVDPVVVRSADELLGFQCITLEQGESRNIQFRFSLDIFPFSTNLGAERWKWVSFNSAWEKQ